MNIAKTLELEKIDKFTSEWNKEVFSFSAKTAKLSPRRRQQLFDMNARPMELAEAMSELITEWDIDWDGEPYPPIAANLANLPTEFLIHILDCVSEVWLGNAQKPSQSANGSAASAK